MLAERDVEIDRLRNSLSKTEESISHARDHTAKLISTLRKRDDEIEDLKDDINEARLRQSKATTVTRREADLSKRRSMPAIGSNTASDTLGRTQIAEPFVEATRAANHSNRVPLPWAPQSIRGYSRLPHEEDRALLWERGAAGSAKHRFGAATEIRSRDDSASKARFHCPAVDDQPGSLRHTRGETHRADHRAVRFGPPPALSDPRNQQTSSSSSSSDNSASRHAAARNRESFSGSETQPSATRMSSQRRSRHTLPMDATLWPPLPAPVVADRNGSEQAAARADAHPSNGRSAIAKPASMPELPRRALAPLQAYVETEAEAESGDDGAEDGSLLD